jgi:hypothetical protein
MMENTTQSEASPSPALLAFRLGWTTSELLGWLRKGVRPIQHPAHDGDEDYAPRLSVSEGHPASKAEAFWLAAQRHGDLAAALGLWPEQMPEEFQQVRRLPGEIERWLKGAQVRDMTPAALRRLLNTWSLEVWSRLEARDDALGRAFVAGMSLADTYWYLRRPSRTAGLDRRLAQEDWRRLLSIYRLDAERGRLQSLAGALPDGVLGVIRRHLRSWSIGTELYYDEGRLQRLAWPFRRSHPLGFLHRWRKVSRSSELRPVDERAIQDALERQAEIWHSLLFGQRKPESYLYARERQWIVWLARGLAFSLLLGLIGGVVIVVASIAAVWLGGVAVPSLFRAVQDTMAQASTTGWNDLLKLISSLLAAVGAFVAVIRPLPGWLWVLYKRIRHWLIVYLVARRTCVPWDRELRKAG